MDSQDTLASLVPLPEVSEPATPQPAHATIPESAVAAVAKAQSSRAENATSNMTPPPSSQVPPSNRAKTRTPTPTVSHISTPPPTVDVSSQDRKGVNMFTGDMSATELSNASAEELRSKVMELQGALHEAKMSAAHHKLQYQMLSKESAAAIERMAVEARMAQYENDVIHSAEQAKAAATPIPAPSVQEGMIPVQKDLYQRMCREIQQLTEANRYLESEHSQQGRTITKQESEIASLSDKVTLMRERIRENREHMNKTRRSTAPTRMDSTPRSIYSTPHRAHVHQDQTQPFAALLQASEMASQEARRPAPTNTKKGHSRNTHSMSSLPVTPARPAQQKHHAVYQTPQGRQPPLKVPSTAPMPRTSALRTPDVYAQPALPVVPATRGPPSDEGTVSAPDDDDEDSEAETDILEPEEGDEVGESQASRAASQMLRSSQEQAVKRDSFKGSGMLGAGSGGDGKGMKQTRLFGAVRKGGVERGGEEPPAKRVRVVNEPRAVGLGIAGVRE